MRESEAETHPLDEDRDPANVAAVRGFAAEVAAQYGGDLTRMRRALGYSNATWVGDGVAVRIAHTPVDMAAEVALVRALPPEVGHPRILGVGTIEGHDWIVTEEVRGQNLHEAWPTLTPAERRRAIRQLWERVQIVHDATPSLRPLVGSHAGFIPATSDDATAAAARAGAAVGLSDVQRSRFHEIIEGYYRAAPFVEQVVAHGDLALMNALWRRRRRRPARLRVRHARSGRDRPVPAGVRRPRFRGWHDASTRRPALPRSTSLLASWIQSTAARCSTAPRCSTSSATSTSGSPAAGPRSGSKTGARTGCSPACSSRRRLPPTSTDLKRGPSLAAT